MSVKTNRVPKLTNYVKSHPEGWFFIILRCNGTDCPEVKTVFFRKRKVTFDKVARFNYELDTNEKLKEELKKLALCRNDITKTEYLSGMLALFAKEGLDITLKELDMLLLLRNKTDQILIERNK